MSLVSKIEKKYDYKDYITWSDDEKWEIIDGIPYNMTPAPTFRHQRIVGNFYRILGNKLINQPCVPGIAPTDVVLSEHDIVQPDVFVVCDKKKITEANIQGAPDLVIEVLSISTALKDRREKKKIYEKYGVKEYIIIDPSENYAERFLLTEEGVYNKSDLFGSEEIMTLSSLESMQINLAQIFET